MDLDCSYHNRILQIQITSESVLFLPLSFFTLGEYNLI